MEFAFSEISMLSEISMSDQRISGQMKSKISTVEIENLNELSSESDDIEIISPPPSNNYIEAMETMSSAMKNSIQGMETVEGMSSVLKNSTQGINSTSNATKTGDTSENTEDIHIMLADFVE